MCQFSAGLRYIFATSSGDPLLVNGDYNRLIHFFNTSITNHQSLSDVDLITTLTRHTGLYSEIQQLHHIINLSHLNLKRTKLDTRQ